MRLHVNRLSPVALATLLAIAHLQADAQPVATQLPVLKQGGAVINATVATPSAGNMNINQTASTSNRALIEWQSFSIGSDARVNIVQPNAQSVLVNRVSGIASAAAPASEIYGAMSSNGRVFLVNPSGVYFGPAAQVNVGSLVATTLDLDSSMTDSNYAGLMAGGNIVLSQSRAPGDGASLAVFFAADRSKPQIVVGEGGSLQLISVDSIEQSGVISAPKGSISLTSASRATLVPATTSGFIELALTQHAEAFGGVTLNSASETLAAGGSIVVGGAAKDEAGRSDFVSVNGLVSTDSASGSAGSISLSAGPGGSMSIGPGARITASSSSATGGSLAVQGRTISIDSGEGTGPILLAEGPTGGGSITVGGSDTTSLLIDSGITLSADATAKGNGGTIIARATYNDNNPDRIPRISFGVAEVYGALTARGGVDGGNGGRIETSGAAFTTSLSDGSILLKSGQIDARARAAGGLAGTWTLDPYDITISSTGPVAVNGSFNPTGPGANVRADDISAALDGGTSVDISTEAAGQGTDAGNITFAAGTAISRSVGTALTSLTLRANNNIVLNSTSIDASKAGPLDVKLYADIDKSGSGSISIVDSAIRTAGGSITLAGGSELAPDYATGGSGQSGVQVARSTLDTRGSSVPGGAGSVTIRGQTTTASNAPGVALAGTFLVGDMSVTGLASQGTGVSLNGADIRTDNGGVDIRGIATRVNGVSLPLIGIDVGTADISLGDGSLVLAGRGDDSNIATSFGGAIGLRYTDLRIAANGNGSNAQAFAGPRILAAANPRTITLVGQATGGSNAAGISATVAGNAGLVISADGSGTSSPTAANIVIGGSSDAGPALLMTSSLGPRIATTGALNYRPLGVDANGAVTEQTGTAIRVLAPAAAASAAGGGFVVSSDLLRRTGSTSSSVSADGGIVVGSAGHAASITVGDAALTQHGDVALTLQNESASASGGIAIGGGNTVGRLGLLSTGNVLQSGPLTVTGALVIRGGSSSTVDLSDTGNRFGVVAFDPPATLSLFGQGSLTVDAASATSFNATSGFGTLGVTGSIGGARALLRSDGAIQINQPITMTDTELAQLDIVSPVSVSFASGATLSMPNGHGWRVFAPSVVGAPVSTTRRNLYGCVYAAGVDCTLSNITPPNGVDLVLFPDRPTVTVTANPVTATIGGAAPALTYTTTGLVNGDTAATALAGALGTGSSVPPTTPGTYAITAGTLSSPTGYNVVFQSADLTLLAGSRSLDTLGITREMMQSRFLADASSDVYGRNLSQPFVCTAASVVRGSVGDGGPSDPLSSEWGKVRNQPQLSGCLNVSDGGQCSAF